ncbi:NAD(+)/NADH kinase [Opitutales bacterium]|nr:NAD(+)/NADH kinase [Opitutales bacterium]MDA8991385.1 NAD(+)/NADH kinase [Opitutales bacterium]
MKPLKRIAIVSNATKSGALQVGEDLKAMAERMEVEANLSTAFPAPTGLLSGMDACFVIGGDGTLLNVMEEAVEYNVPVAGIRHGQLGFLATLSPADMEKQIPPLLRGEYKIRRRSMLFIEDKNGSSKTALNDLVVKSGSNGRLARFSVSVGDEPVADYACDGIVFATPTGSTAYNLASGGPIAHPDAQVVLMTPISAHSLTSRPVVFPSGISLQVKCLDNPDAPLVSADGQTAFENDPFFPLEVSVSSSTFPLLEGLDHSHFRLLRHKLKWG